MKGSQESLTTAVVKDAANWPTPAEQDGKQGGITPFQAKGGNHTNLLHIAAIKSTHGQADPASSSSLGSRQGLWATPRSGKTTDENPETWALRQAKGDVATMPLTAQVKAWATPAAFDWNVPETQAAWAKRAATQKSKGVNLHLPLKSQAVHEAEKQWGTPTARDHQSGRGNEDRQYKELTPMVERQQSGKLNPRWVETLMGLPIGWTMPSCTSPQTIAPMSCDSSAMESCLPPQSEPLELFFQS
jgi:hypothetical protein